MSIDLPALLQALGLTQYAAILADNDVDLEALRLLDEQDLSALGISLGHRKKLLKAIADLDGGGSATPSAVPSEPTSATLGAIAADGERRQLTVMFCDLVDSTALAERLDPEALRDVIRAYQGAAAQVIEQFDGHIAQYLGDGLLVYFGHPLAHEDDAARAVHAGLGIVEAMRTLNARQHHVLPSGLSVRIGIHTGLVVVGDIGDGERREQLALGDTPNLAARLQTLAAPDTVVISDHTRHLAGGSFECADLGEHRLKGVAAPIRIWRIAGLNVAASRFDLATQGTLTPLVGREHEVAMLMDRWQLAQDGEGQVVLLSGEAGIGKSRSLRELRERLHREVKIFLRFQCSPYHVNSAFYPMIDNLEQALKFARDELPESKLDKLEALIVGHYRRPLDDVRFIATILSIPCETRYGPLTMTPQRQKDETIRALVDVVDAAARLQPTALLYEDLHWIDPTSLEVLDLLIDRVRNMPLLIVITYRPEFQPRWSAHGHVTALNLSKLTRAQSGAIVSRLTQGKTLPAEVFSQIIAKTDGVPLYIEELTKSVLESGALRDAGDQYEYVSVAHPFTIPATLRDSLVARFDRVPEVKRIAQLGAAIGREFSHELIAAVAPYTNTELNSVLDKLIDSGLAFRRGTPPDSVYTFKHALVQDAAYESLLKSQRRSLHATISRVLEERFPETKDTEPERLAHHLTEAGETEAAIGYWRKAGELAFRRLALIETISHLNKGLELISLLAVSSARDGAELDLRVLLGTAWMALKGWQAEEVTITFRLALALAKSLGRDELLMPIYLGLCTNVLVQGRVAEALDWVNQILALAASTNAPDLLIVGHQQASVVYSWHGEWTTARAHGEKVLTLYHPDRHGHIVNSIGTDPKTIVGIYEAQWSWMLGYPDQAVVVSDAKDAHARSLKHPFNLGFALIVGAFVFDYRGEPEALTRRAAEAEQVGRDASMPYISEVLAQVNRGIATLRAGRIGEGIPQL